MMLSIRLPRTRLIGSAASSSHSVSRGFAATDPSTQSANLSTVSSAASPGSTLAATADDLCQMRRVETLLMFEWVDQLEQFKRLENEPMDKIGNVAGAFLDFRPLFVGSRLEAGPHLSSEAERISAAAVLSALITKSPYEFNDDLLAICFQALEKDLRDPNLTVRKLAIHGIGHTDHLRGADRAELLTQFVPRAIDAALAELDDHGDRQDQLACESIAASDRLMAVSEPSHLVRVLPQLLKVRPCFEKISNFARAFLDIRPHFVDSLMAIATGACRLQKCQAVGMDRSAVQVRREMMALGDAHREELVLFPTHQSDVPPFSTNSLVLHSGVARFGVRVMHQQNRFYRGRVQRRNVFRSITSFKPILAEKITTKFIREMVNEKAAELRLLLSEIRVAMDAGLETKKIQITRDNDNRIIGLFLALLGLGLATGYRFLSELKANGAAFEILRADLDRKLDKIGEANSAAIETLRADLDRRFEHVERDVGRLDRRFEHVEREVGRLDRRFEHVEREVGRIFDKVGSIEQSILNKEKGGVSFWSRIFG